jgi:hypothetical protein
VYMVGDVVTDIAALFRIFVQFFGGLGGGK